MESTPEVEKALLEWINSFPISHRATSWSDLNNGNLLWEALCDIDSQYFAHELPQPDDEDSDLCISRRENLWQVHKSATAYVHEKYNQVLSHGEKGVVLSLCGRDVPDLEAMAKTASAADSILLSKTILAAAINSQSPEFILRMQHLSEPTKETIKTIIEEMETSTAGITGSSSPTTSTPQIETNGTSNATAMDNDLLLEAQLSKAMTENKRLVSVEKAYREQVARLDRALEENENLKESLKNSQDEVADLKGSARKGSVPQLQEQLRQQSDVIAGQEETIANLERDRKTKQKQIDTLRSSAVKTQNLRDEIDVLKAERDSFAKKANAADKYRQKLQASRQLEQENELLRTELDEVKQWREDTDSAKDRVAGLELAVREYKTTLARSEQDLEELRTTKMRLQHNSEHLSQRVESLLEQQAREQEFIKELQDKLANESPMLAAGALDLDTELANSEKDANALFLEISKLKAEKEKMGNGAGVGAENVKLQLSLDDTYKKYERLESKYLAVQEEKLELESQIAAIQFGSVSQGSEAFLSLQQKWHQANAEVERLKQVVWEITQEMNKTAGKLANAETDLSLIDKDKLDALKEVKQANSTQVVELGRERDLLVKRVKDLEVDLNLQRDLLNKALLDKDSTQTSLVSKTDELRETEKANARLRATLEILNANSSGRQQGASEALENHIVTISEKLESSRENVAQRAKHIQRQNQIIKDLQNRIMKTDESDVNRMAKTKGALSSGQKDMQGQEMKNLQKENALMTTAWYDLTSRLQTNNVVLQRRSEAPKSWLNKQRHLLNTTTRR